MSGPLSPIFLSNNGRGVALACSDSSGGTRVALLGDGDSIVVTNDGDCTGYFEVGGATGANAVPPGGGVSSYPVMAGDKEDQIILDKTESYYAQPYVAGVCKAGETTTLIFHLVQR